MAANELQKDFEQGMRLLPDVEDLLRHEQFPAWIELASREVLHRELTALARKLARAADKATTEFQPSQVEALARRLLLSRDAALIDLLRPLWHAFGTSDEFCQQAVDAAMNAMRNWPREVVAASNDTNDTCVAFSPAHADFVALMADIAVHDSGILGGAVRDPRMVNEARHVGFPVVCKNGPPNVNAGLWVEPSPRGDAEVTGSPNPLEEVWQTVLQAVKVAAADTKCPHLPGWFRSFREFMKARGNTLETFDSAGLSLAMQLLADQQERPLPFGIGFSGRWEAGRLRGVAELGIKQRAAAEAGVFLFFACRDPSDPMPNPIRGVRLVLLAERLSLDDVVRRVNRVCAESGITEYRWRSASSKLEVPTSSTIDSRDLPNACGEDVCPAGFVGREIALAKLQNWQRESRQQHCRRLHVVIGAARTGKTTLLSKWAADTRQLRFFPVWFSFRRGLARGLDQMERDLAAQIDARFSVLYLPAGEPAGRRGEAKKSPEFQPLKKATAATDAAIDIIVDGLDEIHSEKAQLQVLNYLQRLPGYGLVVVGSQDVDALRRVEHVPLELRNDDSAGEKDALELIDSWAEKFEADKLVGIAKDLRSPAWRTDLVERSGGSLAVLNDALAKAADRAWPKSPNELILGKDFNAYCASLLDHMRQAAANFKMAEEFIAYRAFLDNRPWPVRDVLTLMRRDDASKYLLAFRDGGPANIRQFVRIEDGKCRFQTTNLLDFARQHYKDFAKLVANRFIDLLGDSPAPAMRAATVAERKGREQIDDPVERMARYVERRRAAQNPRDLRSYAVRNLPELISNAGNAALFEELAQSSWLYVRLCAMSERIRTDGEIKLCEALLKVARHLETLPWEEAAYEAQLLPFALQSLQTEDPAARGSSRYKRYECFRRGTHRLRDVVDDLNMLLEASSRDGIAPPLALREIISFMRTWGWAMAEHSETDQWWSAAPVFSRLKIKGPSAIQASGTATVLLKPLVKSKTGGYRAEWSTADAPNDLPRKLSREDRRRACEIYFDDYIAVAFNSGKIHIKLQTTADTVAVAYVLGTLECMSVSTRGAQRFLEVQADELIFFDISHLGAASCQ